MRKLILLTAISASLLTLSACGGKSGVFNRERPDEFATARRAPLVVPPDFALAPPRPGQPRPQEADSSNQALEALFGAKEPISDIENSVLKSAAGNREIPTRSSAIDSATVSVNKGKTTKDILDSPEVSSEQATVKAN